MNRWLRGAILVAVIGAHLALLVGVTITTRVREEREDTSVFKMVDVAEYVPPPPEPEPEPPPPPPERPQRQVVESEPAETVIETDEEVAYVEEQPHAEPAQPTAIEYLPQHRISVAPDIPTEEIRSRVEYPALANRQGIEGVVYLELFIDAEGVIQRIEILREPGYGLGEAAIAAFEGITVAPAEANGTPVAVRYRYPIRFELR
jgi:protein TonB